MKKVNTRQNIIEALYLSVAKYGIENTTTKKISALAGTSENVLYKHFESKNQLFEIAFFELNCKIDLALKNEYLARFGNAQCDNSAKFASLAWLAYLDFWVANPNYTIFYDRYIHSSLADKDVWSRQAEAFAFFTSTFKSALQNLPGKYDFEGYMVILTIVIESAINIAKRSIQTAQPISQSTKSLVCDMINNIMDSNN